MASIAELFAMGQQRRMQREQFEDQQEMRQMQMDQLIQDRALDQRRTAPEYAEYWLKATDPNLADKDAAQFFSKLSPADLQKAMADRQDLIKARDERHAQMMNLNEMIGAYTVAGKKPPEGLPQQMDRDTFEKAFAEGGKAELQAERLDLQERKFQAGQVLKEEELGLKKLRATTTALLAQGRMGVMDATARNLEARTKATMVKIALGEADIEDLKGTFGALVVGAGGALDEDEAALVNQAATEAWEMSVFDGKPLSDAMNEMILKYDIGKKSPTEKGEAALTTARTTPSGRGAQNPVGALFAAPKQEGGAPPAPATPDEKITAALAKFGDQQFTSEQVLKDAGMENTLENRNLVRKLYKQRGK
jgi:hypothetical protein